MNRRPASPADHRHAAPGGFTFLELLVVMGTMAVILGLGIGFLTRVGTAARVYQAASILTEAGFECQNRSAGGRTATLIVSREKDEDDSEHVVVTQSIQRPVLTSHFENADLTFAAAGPDQAKTSGSVVIDPNGYSGSCAVLSKNGMVDFGTQAIYAPTDGLAVDVAVRPSGARGTMTLLRGEEAYEVILAKDASYANSQDAYKVVLRLALVPADGARRLDAAPTWATFETATSPVHAGAWSTLSLSYNGREAVLKVDGVDRTRGERRDKDAPPLGLYRLAVPSSGGVRLTVSSERYSYEGAIDDLQVSGIFRNDEDRRVLRGDVDILAIHGATRTNALPIRVVWWNGRLDPSVHKTDEILELSSETEEGRYVVTFGLYGVITPPAKMTGGGSAQSAVPTTPAGK